MYHALHWAVLPVLVGLGGYEYFEEPITVVVVEGA